MGIGDWWRKLWARPEDAELSVAPEDDPSSPAVRVDTFELTPRLRVHMFRHAIRARDGVAPLRTLVSEGLAAWGAAEVSVTQPADWGDPALGSALNLLKDLATFAADGRPAVLGGHTGFYPKAFGLDRLVGVTYARGTAVRGLPGGSANLAAVLLHAEEFELVQRGLASRVLGRLAARALYFPYPACWELRDRPVLGLDEQKRSAIHDVGPRLNLGDARVTLVDDLILDVSLPPTAVGVFREFWDASPDQNDFLFHADLAPDATLPPGWVRHEPSGGARRDTGRVAVSGVVLLVTNEELAERVETRALADLVERATKAMERVAGEHPVAAKVPVAAAFTLRPGALPEVQVAWQGGEAPTLLGPLHDALSALEPVEVSGVVAFRLDTEVHPHPLGN